MTFKPATTTAMYDLITVFYKIQLSKVKFCASRSWCAESMQQHRLEFIVLLLKTGVIEELPDG